MQRENKQNITFSKDLLEKYYQKRCSDEEKEIVEQWFAGVSFSKEITSEAHRQWENSNKDGAPSGMLDDAFYKIHYRLHMEEIKEVEKKSWLNKTFRVMFYASAVVVLFLLAYNLWTMRGAPSGENPVYTEIYAPLGSRIKFDLPDGSKGWLNSGSSLKFPVRFTGRERKVFLSGEGYFDVSHNAKKSFVVNTKSYQVRALGTSFNVQAFEDNAETEEITLEEGKVQIEKVNNEGKYRKLFSLEPGQHAQIDMKTQSVTITEKDNDKYTAWKDGKLIFRNDPLERLIENMERFYNVEIEITDKKLYEYHFHATFEEETLFETLRLLKLSTPVDYKICKREKNQDGIYAKRKVKLFLRK
jgi:ferric-dicitrate binding protein FerR (iron transport regulator)